jgi:tryptophanyl-tRNA synthetase
MEKNKKSEDQSPEPLSPRQQIVLSGTKPTGANLHLGNYFGALRQFVDLQEGHDSALYFIADYHSMTSIRNGAERRANTEAVALDYLAAGLDPNRAILFRQSDLSEVTELTWILTSITPMGMLERAHAYKAAMDKGEDIDHGLFTYPVLMAADILLYGAHLVPVGKDQKQHIEMARDMAQRFNRLYDCEALVLPEPYILEDTATIPGTDGRKMSKSYGNTISMFAPKGKVKKSVMGIVTDSSPVEAPKDTSQAVFDLWRFFATESEREDLFERAVAGGLGYGDVKKDLLARLMDYFEPMRTRRAEYEEKPGAVEEILRNGAERARALATPVLESCRSAAGLGRP